MADTRKYILWVEDFAGSTDLFDIDLQEPDRREEIIQNFPDYLRDHVEIVEDPTKLPDNLSEHGSNYGLIILDINFEHGLDREKTSYEKLVKEICDSGIHIREEHQNPDSFAANLGYYLYFYLRNKWNIPHSRIIFNSAYTKDAKNAKDDTLAVLMGSLRPEFIDKHNPEKNLNKYLEELFPDTLEKLALIKAKDILTYWKKHGSLKNSIFSRVAYIKDPGIDEDGIFDKIDNALSSTSTDDHLIYSGVLSELSHPFEAKIDRRSQDWNREAKIDRRSQDWNREAKIDRSSQEWGRTVFSILKNIRNICAHRDFRSDNSCIDVTDFILLFAIGMRVLFDNADKPGALLEAERWLMKHLNKRYTNDFAAKFKEEFRRDANKEEIKCHMKELLLMWYVMIARDTPCAGSLAPIEKLIDAGNKKYKYTFSDVVHMFCIKATGFNLSVTLSISSSMPQNKLHNEPPQINCETYFRGEKKDKFPDSWDCDSMKTLAKEYVISQLSHQTIKPEGFRIFL